MVEGRLTAAKHAFVALVLAAGAFIYLSIGELNRSSNFDKKYVLAQILAVRDIAKGAYKTQPATDRDISSFSTILYDQYSDLFLSALKERQGIAGDPVTPEKGIQYPGDNSPTPKLDEMERRFGDRVNGVGEVVRDVPFPYSSTKKCDALLIKPDEYFFFYNINMLFFGDFSNIYSRDVRYVMFENGCQEVDRDRFRAVILPSTNGVISVALPKSSLSIFPTIKKWTDDTELYMDSSVRERIVPGRVRKYFPNDKDLFILDLRAIEVLAIDALGTMDGKAYSVDDLSRSIVNIYDRDHEKTSLGGIGLDSLDFMRIVPVWMFCVTYYYWRQLRALKSAEFEGNNWVPLDGDDFVGYAVAVIWALSPLLLTVCIYVLYPEVFNLAQPVFGYAVSPSAIWNWDFKKIFVSEPQWTEYFGDAMLFLVWFHLFVAYLCTRISFSLVRRNNRLGSAWMAPWRDFFRNWRSLAGARPAGK